MKCIMLRERSQTTHAEFHVYGLLEKAEQSQKSDKGRTTESEIRLVVAKGQGGRDRDKG